LSKNGAIVLYTVPVSNVAEIGFDSADSFLATVQQGLQIENLGEPCDVIQSSSDNYAAIDAYQYQIQFQCEEELDTIIFSYLLFPDDLDQVNNAVFRIGINTKQIPLGPMQREVEIPVAYLQWERGWELPDKPYADPGRVPSIYKYFTLGYTHVLTGYDHMAFLLGLLLLVTGLRHLILLITAFTIAHSITLGLSGLDIASFPVSLTESAIAFSICYVGVENLIALRRESPSAALERRWITTFLFGLIHGFGFSFMLRELGLPPDAMVPALLLFNLGVEAGQISVVVLPFLILRWCIIRWGDMKWPAMGGSVIVILLGAYWLSQRLVNAFNGY